MKYIIIPAVAVITVLLGLFLTPIVFAGRVLPGFMLGGYAVGGLQEEDVSGVIKRYESEILDQALELRLGDTAVAHTLEELGVRVDYGATAKRLLDAGLGDSLEARRIPPVLNLDTPTARQVLHDEFKEVLALPRNASLTIGVGNSVALARSQSGEQIDVVTLQNDIERVVDSGFNQAIDLAMVSAEAPVQDSEVEFARSLAEQLLESGLTLSFEDKEFTITPFTIRRLLAFTEQVDRNNRENTVLGVLLDPEGLQGYLETTIQSEVDQDPVNARFEIDGDEGRVSQFALPQRGQKLHIEDTIRHINSALAVGEKKAALAVAITEPEIKEEDDLRVLGIQTLLAKGESNFAGSPANRVHNIKVGASKYNGLLVAPGEEFSFNKFLGPVDAENGFKPELVIKSNVTVPEYGGGLCQVSTTIFRAAAHSGMEITNRRNHSYAVSYYGTPGFDATIYPPYTDFRFLNNTPGHILIQTKIAGTIIAFEFWGTDDGRAVEVSGPYPYERQPNGAVKATLTQSVTRDGEAILEDTFYSNYRSPELFPKVLSENGEKQPVVAGASATPNPPNQPDSAKPDNTNSATGAGEANQIKASPTAAPPAKTR